jgi:hypothetical protein
MDNGVNYGRKKTWRPENYTYKRELNLVGGLNWSYYFANHWQEDYNYYLQFYWLFIT